MVLLATLACLAPGLGADETDGVVADELAADAFVSSATSDLGEMGATADSVTSVADASQLDPATADRCTPTAGDCVSCLTVTPEGGGSGTILIEPEATPCGATWTNADDVTFRWTLDESRFEGTYVPYEQGRTISLTGSRSRTVATTGRADGDFTWTAQLAVTDLLFETDGQGGVVRYVVAMSYEGFGDSSWTLVAEGGGGVLEGTATNGDLDCIVSGTAVDPQITCG